MKTFTIKLMILFGLFFSAKLSHAQNILSDGNFNTTTVITPYLTGTPVSNIWCSWLNTGTNVGTSVSAGVCNYSIINGGTNSWDVQLNQWGFPLITGNRYKLTFDVRANANRSFGVFLGENEGQWTNFNTANYLQQATPNWQTKTIECDVTAAFSLYKLSFEMGAENISMYFDNIVLENLGASPFRVIELIGSAVPPFDWSAGVDMQTTDGVNYTLSNYTLAAGEVKFRQDRNWSVNWGGYNYPNGFGFQDGPNIAVAAGVYNINFNRLSGAYNFECLSCPTTIGIIGSAVPPVFWFSDVNMITVDGINFTLNDYFLVDGELRFRQDDNWIVNWGGFNFPSGIGDGFAPNIQVTAGSYNISFNRITGVYNFERYIPRVGILGSALNGWLGDDIPMNTMDGTNYTLLNYALANGEAKFRQNNEWTFNWGNTFFPTGFGYQNGPNIPVTAGIYDISFNRFTGEYKFCTDAVLQCTENIVVNAASGFCGEYVWYDLPMVTEGCVTSFIQTAGLPQGSFFPVGTTTNTFLATSLFGETSSCSFNVTVNDVQAPIITQVSANPAILWPANHKMQNVMINYNAWDNCGAVTTVLTVSSNEPVTGTGDGNTAPDWLIIDDHQIQLRAERAGSGTGRIYTITITATDAYGNTSTETTHVFVPHDMNVMNNNSGVANATTGNINSTEMYSDILKCTVLPNPGTQFFNLQIETKSEEKIEVNLFDISGKLNSRLNTLKNQTLRFGDNLKPGIYIVEIRQGKQTKTIKVVKQ